MVFTCLLNLPLSHEREGTSEATENTDMTSSAVGVWIGFCLRSTGIDLAPSCSRKDVYLTRVFFFFWSWSWVGFGGRSGGVSQFEMRPSPLNFIPLNCWIKTPPWLLSLGALAVSDLEASEPSQRSAACGLMCQACAASSRQNSVKHAGRAKKDSYN